MDRVHGWRSLHLYPGDDPAVLIHRIPRAVHTHVVFLRHPHPEPQFPGPDSCRFHKGVSAGMDYQADLIKTLLADHQATEYVQQRHAELETRAAQSSTTDTNTSTHQRTPGAATDLEPGRPGASPHHEGKPVPPTPIELTSFGYLHQPTDTAGQPVPPTADRTEDVREPLRDPAARNILDLDGRHPDVQDVVLENSPAESPKRTAYNDRLRERVSVYAQVIHELRTELDRRTDNSTQRSSVRSLPASVT
jgi:hypothetical protein